MCLVSAYMVGQEHIDALLTWALADPKDVARVRWFWPALEPDDDHAAYQAKVHVLDYTTADETGAKLWHENLRSVAARYPSDADGERPGPIGLADADVLLYRFDRLPGNARGLEAARTILNALRCYEYQACEHDGWRGSEAHAICEAIRYRAIERLVASNDTWEITDRRVFCEPTLAERRASRAS